MPVMSLQANASKYVETILPIWAVLNSPVSINKPSLFNVLLKSFNTSGWYTELTAIDGSSLIAISVAKVVFFVATTFAKQTNGESHSKAATKRVTRIEYLYESITDVVSLAHCGVHDHTIAAVTFFPLSPPSILAIAAIRPFMAWATPHSRYLQSNTFDV